MSIFSNIINTEGPLRRFHLALFSADVLAMNRVFWFKVLEAASATQSSATPQASLAIKTFVETKLAELGPSEVMGQLKKNTSQ